MKNLKNRLMWMIHTTVAIEAFIQIPVPYMDYFTLQILFIILSELFLGSRGGLMSSSIQYRHYTSHKISSIAGKISAFSICKTDINREIRITYTE